MQKRQVSGVKLTFQNDLPSFIASNTPVLRPRSHHLPQPKGCPDKNTLRSGLLQFTVYSQYPPLCGVGSVEVLGSFRPQSRGSIWGRGVQSSLLSGPSLPTGVISALGLQEHQKPRDTEGGQGLKGVCSSESQGFFNF